MLFLITVDVKNVNDHIYNNVLPSAKLVKNAPPQFDLHEKVPSQQLYPIFDALNTVGSVPWIINQPVSTEPLFITGHH